MKSIPVNALTHCVVALLLAGAPCSVWASSAAPIVPPDVAMTRLRDGNTRFMKGKPKRPNGDPKRRAELANSQRPFAIVVSCSDSRVPPELVFDAGLGDLFVVRTAGEVVTAIELGSIEYAVDHLGASLIIVLGHERCGAVKATVEHRHPPALPVPGAAAGHADAAHGEHDDGHGEAHGDSDHGEAHGDSDHGDAHGDSDHGDAHGKANHGKADHGKADHGKAAHGKVDPDSVAPPPRDHIGALIEAILPAVEAAERRKGRDLLDEAVRMQARLTVRHLVEESPLLKAFLVSGRLRIVAGRYDLDTGAVEVLR